MISKENEQAESGNSSSNSVEGNAVVSTTTSEMDLLRAECERLKRQVQALEQECEAYRQTALAYELQRITPADIERYSQQEPGLPLEAFMHELEQIGKEP